MFRISSEVETFRSLLSEKLGVAFSPRKSSSNFFVNIQAFPGRIITDNELFDSISECLGVLDIQLDAGSMCVEKGGLVWMKMEKEGDIFSLGVTNDSMKPNYSYIIVTATPI